MPCNLAVTITKATVLPDHLQNLLTPDVVEALVTAFLEAHPEYKTLGRVYSWKQGADVVFRIGDFTITVSNGKEVTVNSPRWNRTEADTLSEQITILLAKGAGRLFAAQVKQALVSKFGNVQTQSTTVDNQGQQQHVTVFSLEL